MEKPVEEQPFTLEVADEATVAAAAAAAVGGGSSVAPSCAPRAAATSSSYSLGVTGTSRAPGRPQIVEQLMKGRGSGSREAGHVTRPGGPPPPSTPPTSALHDSPAAPEPTAAAAEEEAGVGQAEPPPPPVFEGEGLAEVWGGGRRGGALMVRGWAWVRVHHLPFRMQSSGNAIPSWPPTFGCFFRAQPLMFLLCSDAHLRCKVG